MPEYDMQISEVIMPWNTVNRVPEFYARLQEEAEKQGRRKPSMKAIAEQAGIDYSVAYNWFTDRINTFSGKVANQWADFFGHPVVVQAPLDDSGQPILDDPGSFTDLLDNL